MLFLEFMCVELSALSGNILIIMVACAYTFSCNKTGNKALLIGTVDQLH